MSTSMRSVGLIGLGLSGFLGVASCNDYGRCQADPDACNLKQFKLMPVEYQLGTTSPVTFVLTAENPWPFSQANPPQVVFSGPAKVTPTNVSLNAGRTELTFMLPTDGLVAGSYSVTSNYPSVDLQGTAAKLTVLMPPTPLAFSAWSMPTALPAPANASPAPKLSVRGLWVGAPPIPGAQAELVVFRSYESNTGKALSVVSRLNPAQPMSWLDPPDAAAGYALGMWRFLSPARPAPKVAVLLPGNPPETALLTGAIAGPSLNSGVLKDLTTPLTQLGLVVQSDTNTAFLLLDLGMLKAYWTDGQGVKAAQITGAPTATWAYLTGYADDAAGQKGLGVLGFDVQGRPHLFRYENNAFRYDTAESKRLQDQLGMGAVDSVAVGDLDGNGTSDIAVVRGRFVQIYRAGKLTEDKLALPDPVQKATLAIGQYDGSGRDDLVIIDNDERMCGPAACQHVYVAANQTR